MNNENKVGVLHFKEWFASFIPHILKELYLDKIYDPYLSGKTDLVIIDAGFNIGLFSMFAFPCAKVIYGFEPSKESYEIGLKNLKENNITNVKLFQQAIAKEDGEIPFYHADNSTANSTLEAVNTKPELEEKVMGIRFDTFVKQESITHIDFMKLDIEGSECEVIGSKSFENIVPILDAFVVEYHTWSNTNVQQLVTTIRDYGYKVDLIPSSAVVLGCVKIK